jgi:hypothetical protein
MFVSSTSVYLAVRVVWVSDSVVIHFMWITLLTRVQKHVLMLAYISYMSTSTLTLHYIDLDYTLLVVINYSHTLAGELLDTLHYY